MKRLVIAAALLAAFAADVAAQTKTITGERKTIAATVESIEQSTRQVTLLKQNGEYLTITVPSDVAAFDTMKIGDKITVTYYENLVLRVQQPGEQPKDTGAAAVTKAGGATTGGTAAAQRTITATITHIDPTVPSITFTGPNGWKYSSRVEDKQALAKVKVGDKVDITWTDAVLITVGPDTKRK